MQGPGGQAPQRRRAGENQAWDDGVRDWQRNTWFGPAPQNENPFDEPEDAPELRDIRSENVNEHIGDFWKSETAGYAGPGRRTGNTVPAEPVKKSEKEGGHKGLKVLLILAAALAAVALVLRYAVFSVRNIQVTGNSSMSAEDVIRSSGIHRGDGILTLNEKTVEEKINSNYKLKFRYLEKKLPDTVVISIREREECCWLNYCGICYTMDKNLMVLSETEDRTKVPDNLVEVKGLDIRSGYMTGQRMILNNERQQTLLSQLFLETKVLGCNAEIKDADLSNPDSILLTTRDGYTVAMGNDDELHAKLRSLFLVREKLREMGKVNGTIHVNNPESPFYSPPEGVRE